jgi:hypothetical protein
MRWQGRLQHATLFVEPLLASLDLLIDGFDTTVREARARVGSLHRRRERVFSMQENMSSTSIIAHAMCMKLKFSGQSFCIVPIMVLVVIQQR